MNKKHICLFLAIFFLVLNTIPYIGVFADDDIVIYDPDSNTDLTEQLNYDPTDLGVLQIIYGILQNGSSVDFSNTSLSTSNNPWNDFINLLTSSVIGVDPEIWDDAIDASLESIASYGVIVNGLTGLFPEFGAFGIDYLTGLAQYYDLGLSDSVPNTPTPQPDLDFSFISNDNDWIPFNTGNNANVPFINGGLKVGKTSLEGIYALFDGITQKEYSYFTNANSWNTSNFYFSDIITINLYYNSELDRYIASYDGYNPIYIYYNNYNTYGIQLTNNNDILNGENFFNIYNQYRSDPRFTPQTSFVGLSTAINYIHNHFRHYNLYVNGTLWVWSGSTSNSIAIGGNTYINNIPAPIQYIVPDNSYLDLNALKQKILDAIMGAGLLQWVDIADCIVDVNGNQVIYTYNVIRNDYDVLYREQYPETLIPDNGNYFNKNLLVNYRNELQTPVLVVENTLDVLPSDLKACLYICGILAIFALVINRLLE